MRHTLYKMPRAGKSKGHYYIIVAELKAEHVMLWAFTIRNVA